MVLKLFGVVPEFIIKNIKQEAKVKFVLIIGLLIFAVIDPAVAETAIKPSKSQHHVYLLIGQSNMAGRAKFTGEDTKAIANAFLLNDKGEWVEAKNPLNQYSTIRKDIKVQRMGPGYHFAKSMVSKNKDITIGLVVNAKGGTRISQWKKGTAFFNDAVKRTKKATETGTLKGILWHQGEGDQKNKKYIVHLSQFIRDLREALAQPTLPLIAGEIRESGIAINKQINQLPKEVENTGVASSKALTTFDGTHFDAASAKVLGIRFAEEMSKLVK